jgi:hypothetical protein
MLHSWVWWLMAVIPAVKRLWQEDHEFKASLGYIARPCLKQIFKTLYSLVQWKKVWHKSILIKKVKI